MPLVRRHVDGVAGTFNGFGQDFVSYAVGVLNARLFGGKVDYGGLNARDLLKGTLDASNTRRASHSLNLKFRFRLIRCVMMMVIHHPTFAS
jgi:hypothetical protein